MRSPATREEYSHFFKGCFNALWYDKEGPYGVPSCLWKTVLCRSPVQDGQMR